MSDENNVRITGKLTRDPIYKENEDKAIPPCCEVYIVNNRYITRDDGSRSRISTFTKVLFWGAKAKAFMDEELRKGDKVHFENGYLRDDNVHRGPMVCPHCQKELDNSEKTRGRLRVENPTFIIPDDVRPYDEEDSFEREMLKGEANQSEE